MFQLQAAVTPFLSDVPPLLVEDYPRDRNGAFDTAFDVILWSCAGSEMAPSDNAGGRVPNGIELVEDVADQHHLGYRKVTSRWREVMLAQFDILSKSNAQANYLVNWFHRSMMTYAFIDKFFTRFGVTYLKYEGRGRDMKSVDFGQDLYKRQLLYSVRLDLLVVERAKAFETVRVAAGLPSRQDAPDVFEVTTLI